ncbi:MAG: sulfatase-like hydrolase/transferase [Pseudomonadota bacterium]
MRTADGRPQNVLILIADEMRRDAPGCFGGDARTMPALDKLAAGGTVFERAYTPSPICIPARAAIATGHHVHTTQIWDSATAYAGQPRSWMHALGAAGQPVTSFGKLHFLDAQSDTGFAEQVLPMHIVDGVGWPQALLRGSGTFDQTEEFAQDVGYGDSPYMDYDRATTEAICAYLADPARHDQPWAAFVSWACPHFPLVAPQAYADLFDPAELAPPLAYAPEARPTHPELRWLAEFYDYDRFFTPERVAEARAAYLALCRFVDDQIAAVMAALSEAGLTENTLVVFTSDHGEMLGDHGIWTKQVMYEASAGVPMVLAGPGVPVGRCKTPVSLIDLAPTALAAAGLSGVWLSDATGLPGNDLASLATGPDNPGRTAFSEYHDGGSSTGTFMVRWDDWKYVHYVGLPPQLFDLASDPHELTDLAAVPSAAATLAEGRARLAAICDAEAVNAAAITDQQRRLANFGGVEGLKNLTTFGHTPAPTA